MNLYVRNCYSIDVKWNQISIYCILSIYTVSTYKCICNKIVCSFVNQNLLISVILYYFVLPGRKSRNCFLKLLPPYPVASQYEIGMCRLEMWMQYVLGFQSYSPLLSSPLQWEKSRETLRLYGVLWGLYNPFKTMTCTEVIHCQSMVTADPIGRVKVCQDISKKACPSGCPLRQEIPPHSSSPATSATACEPLSGPFKCTHTDKKIWVRVTAHTLYRFKLF